jgi:FKBP-type peptidyl-prolyl cis-trans isomerase FkpA
MRRLLPLLAVLSLAACNLNVADVPNSPTDPATETFAASLKIDIPTMTKTTHGVYYKDVSMGQGDALTGTPVVVITYEGFIKTGALFTVGSQQQVSLATLVVGLQEGMQGMKSGGERIIVIPSALGYGNSVGLPVPPNSTLVWDMKLELIP